MSIAETGVRLVAENAAGFDSAISRANAQIKSLGDAAAGAQGAVGGFSVSTGAMAVAIGSLAAGAIQTLASGILSIGSAGVQAASELQNLTVSLESLAAREILQSGATNEMASALKAAQPEAQVLLERIKELSLASPFEYKDIVGVFRLNMAFGQSADMSLKLTKAITDVTAASGQGSVIMERLAYNFSQMSMTGQITMRDVRDLALAGLDLNSVLRDGLNKTLDETNDALKTGEITMEDVSQAFVDYAAKNFGSAAQRMSATFSGLKSSINDLLFFSAIDIFGPMLETATQKLSELFSAMRAFVDSGALKTLGANLGEAAQYFWDFGETAIEALAAVQPAAEQTFSETVDSSFEWGYNVADQFAVGILEGAAAVVDALSYIAGVVTEWLAPGSPPKLLPDLPEWGANAAEWFANGFSDADMSAIAKMAPQIQDELDKVSKRVALREINAEMSKTAFDDAQAQVDDLVANYNKLVEAGAAPDVLKAKMEEIKAAEKIRDEAQKKAAADAKALTEEKKREEILKNMIKLKEDEASASKEAASAGKKAAAEEGEKTPRGGGGAAKALGVPKKPDLRDLSMAGERKEIEDAIRGLSNPFKEAKQAAQDFATSIGNLGKAWNELKIAVQPTIDTLKPALDWIGANGTRIIGGFAAAFAGFQFGTWLVYAAQVLEVVGGLGGAMAALKVTLLGTAGALSLATIAAAALPLALAALAAVIVIFGADALNTLKMIGAILAYYVLQAYNSLVMLGAIISYYAQQALNWMANLGSKIAGFFADANKAMTAWITETNKSLDEYFKTQEKKFSDGWQNIKISIATGISNALLAVNNFFDRFRQAGASIMDGLKQGIVEKIQEIIDAVKGAIEGAIKAGEELLDTGSPSKVTRKVWGNAAGEGAALGMLDAIPMIEAAATKAAGAVMPPSTPAQIRGRVAAQTASSTINNNSVVMNNNVSSQIDVSLLAQVVQQVISQQLRTA